MSELPTALEGIRVLDFSRVLAGPFATMLLGDLGANVTKVERPGTGDDTRAWGPPYDDSGLATYFQAVNRNKQNIVLDLSEECGRERALELACASDVLVENFRPGVMDRLGLGYDVLSHTCPGLIYCSITGFGRGAGATLPAYDLLVQALGGLMSITGEADREPQKVGVALVDVLAGLFACVGVLGALRHRERTGEGQRVEVDLLTSLLAALVNQGSGYTLAGVVPTRIGNRHPSIAPYELMPCSDGELVLAVGNDRQFAALCEAIERPQLAEDAHYRTNAARVHNREELRALLQEPFAARPTGQWVELLSAARVPCGTVNDIAAAFALAEQLGLEPFVELPRAEGGSARLTRNPIGFSATPPVYRSGPPALPDPAPDPAPAER